jgi:hypothetical protein
MFGGRKTYRKGRKACRKSRRGGRKTHRSRREGGGFILFPNGKYM